MGRMYETTEACRQTNTRNFLQLDLFGLFYHCVTDHAHHHDSFTHTHQLAVDVRYPKQWVSTSSTSGTHSFESCGPAFSRPRSLSFFVQLSFRSRDGSGPSGGESRSRSETLSLSKKPKLMKPHTNTKRVYIRTTQPQPNPQPPSPRPLPSPAWRYSRSSYGWDSDRTRSPFTQKFGMEFYLSSPP